MENTGLLVILLQICLLLTPAGAISSESEKFLTELSEADETIFISTTTNVYHMELDLYRPGNIVYIDGGALMTSNGTTTDNIAGSIGSITYQEGVGESARFYNPRGFAQISKTEVIVADYNNYCLRHVYRTTRATATYAGHCRNPGYEDGTPGKFRDPIAVIQDLKNSNQLLVADSSNQAMRTVAISNKLLGTHFKSSKLNGMSDSIQEETTGDILVSTTSLLVRLDYNKLQPPVIIGRSNTGYLNGLLGEAMFNNLGGLFKLDVSTTLISDRFNNKIRFYDNVSGKTAAVNICANMTDTLQKPYLSQDCHIPEPMSLLRVNKSLFVGSYGKITAYYRLLRRLVFEAEYSLKCSSVSGDVSRSALQAVSESNYKQISEVCSSECSVSPRVVPKITCSDDILTVQWPTDTTFSTGVIPDEIRKAINNRLAYKGSGFHILLMNQRPPVVYPRKNKDGSSAVLKLIEACPGGTTYDLFNDTCQ